MNKYLLFGLILIVSGCFSWWFLKSCRETLKNVNQKKIKDTGEYIKNQLQ